MLLLYPVKPSSAKLPVLKKKKSESLIFFRLTQRYEIRSGHGQQRFLLVSQFGTILAKIVECCQGVSEKLVPATF